jgi:redox-sensitive bicupin YhaK (pirin superfamily)
VASGMIEVDGTRYEQGNMLVLTPGASVSFTAEKPSIVMAIGGEPIGPRFIEWNFVSSSYERIEQAKADWRAGRMKLPDLDNEEWIPLPDPSPPPEPMS